MGYGTGTFGAKWIQDLIVYSFKNKKHRLDLTLILYRVNKKRKNIEFLVVESTKAPNERNFIQEGAELHDKDLEPIIKRALSEVGIDVSKIEDVHFIDYESQDLPEGRDKRGFENGKTYFIWYAKYSGNGYVRPDKIEVRKVEWLGEAETRKALRNKRPEKKRLLDNALDEVVKSIYRQTA